MLFPIKNMVNGTEINILGADDSYKDSKDSRSNFQKNEVAFDYNAGFTMCLAELLHFGLGKKDGQIKFDRAWPQKYMVPDISISMDKLWI